MSFFNAPTAESCFSGFSVAASGREICFCLFFTGKYLNACVASLNCFGKLEFDQLNEQEFLLFLHCSNKLQTLGIQDI